MYACMCVCVCMNVLFANIHIRNAQHVWNTPSISNTNSSWNNRKVMKWKIPHPWGVLKPRPLDYMPKVLTAKLRKYDTFQFMVWDTSSSDFDIFVCKGYNAKYQYAWATASISTVSSCSWNNRNFMWWFMKMYDCEYVDRRVCGWVYIWMYRSMDV